MKKIAQIVNETNPQFLKLMTCQKNLEKIKTILQTIELFKKHTQYYRLIKYAQGILYIGVSTAAFATQIRYNTMMILQTLQEKLPDITINAIQCQVTTFTSMRQTETLYRKNEVQPISKKTKENLLKLAQSISSETIRQSLKKLSRG